ncbi:MAG: hypothetical protein JO112_09475, partial [Planctomycetes bacterium]|nr:hypothetical protein [Planctomycetota bacterium]
MNFPTPFAYGRLGGVLVSTDTSAVFVCPEETEGPHWVHSTPAPVVGVRHTCDGILVVDAQGLLVQLDTDLGQVQNQLDCAVPAGGLSGTVQGDWAVFSPEVICLGRGTEQRQRLRAAEVSCAALDDRGHALAVGSATGQIVVIDLRTQDRRTLQLEGPITGLHGGRLGGWLITTPKAIFRADRKLVQHETLVTLGENLSASGGVTSPDGRFCAFRAGDHTVMLVGYPGGQVGSVEYADRVVGEIEFGPPGWLGIGIGQGDGNRISLTDSSVYRTETPPGRTRHSWLILVQLDAKACRKCRPLFPLLEPQSAEPLDVLPVSEPSIQAAATEDIPEVLAAEPASSEAEAPLAVLPLSEAEPPLDVLPVSAPAIESPEPPASPAAAGEPPPLVEDTTKLLPFALQPGEKVLLRGGFGGMFGWVWTIPLVGLFLAGLIPLIVLGVVGKNAPVQAGGAVCGGVFLVILLITASWPYLLSGRYWLTNRRLFWKPRLRRVRSIPLAELRECNLRARPITSSLLIRGKRRLSLRFIGGMERLWGGLMLFRQLSPQDFRPQGMPTGDMAWWTAYRRQRVSLQKGLAILRPDYFAFLPSEAGVNLLGELAKGATGLVGVHWTRARAKMPLDLLVQELRGRDPDHFDRNIFETAQRFGGLIRRPGEVDLTREEVPLRPSREGLVFRIGSTIIRGVPSQEQRPVVDRMLMHWTRGRSIPKHWPFLKTVVLATLASIPALALAWAGIVVLKEPHQDLGLMAPAAVLDADKVPSGSFVTVSGHPDLDHLGPISQREEEYPKEYLLVLREEPRLILFCPRGQPLYETIRRYQYGPDTAAAEDELAKTWT